MKNYLYLKRFFDIIFSGLAIIMLTPLFIMISIAIRIDSKGPVFFKQKRIKKDNELFNIYKFRTMKIETPSNMPTHLLKNPDMYITRVGKFLRKTSMDELPQMLNIFKGDMSIIGPRPALWNQYDLIAERDKYGVNDIRPGLTGWAQINGRDTLEIKNKAKYDGIYKERLSLLFDLKVLYRTILYVFRAECIVEGSQELQNLKDQNYSTEIQHSAVK